MHRFVLILVIAIVATPVFAQVPGGDGTAAFLFAYYPKDGKQAEFDTGVTKHVEFHKQVNDPYVWYSWYVVAGDNVGLFVNGTFGLRFPDLDKRMNRDGDVDDLKKNIYPYADTFFRRVYKLRGDLSTGTPLEDRTPLPLAHVLYYTIRPGWETEFEGVINTLQATLSGNGAAPVWTCYQLSVGGAHPTYLVIISRENWGAFSGIASMTEVVRAFFQPDDQDSLLDMLSESVEDVHSEVWQYRPMLSYFPSE